MFFTSGGDIPTLSGDYETLGGNTEFRLQKHNDLSQPFKYPKSQPGSENCLKCLMYDDW